jgi:hypothetical protein
MGAAGAGAAGTTGKAGTGGAGMGAAGAGAAGMGAAGTGAANGDTPPPRALNVTIAPGAHTHGAMGVIGSSGMDNTGNRKMAGKLIIDLGVDSGGYQGYLGKRGFHVIGVSFHHCAHIDSWGAPYGRDYHMNCRFTTFDGMQRGGAENDANGAVNATNNIAYKVKTGLTMLNQMFPTEDWGYFLNQDGSVRWSDVGFTGYSHGAQTAAALAHLVRLYRAVSRSGPRDNNCGKGVGACPPNPASPPYDPACASTGIAAWQDLPFVTPVERVYSFAGTQDGQYGDDQFSTFHMKYRGDVISIDNDVKPTGSNRYCANAGHGGFEDYAYALDEAFGTPMENRTP